MSQYTQVSAGQLTALVEFIEQHPELALGRINRTIEGRSQMKRLWLSFAEHANSVDASGVSKTPEGWRTFFNEFKSKLIRKVKKQKAELSATGGGRNRAVPLTDLQDRLYTVLGRDIGEPLPGVRHNPLIDSYEVEVAPDGSINFNSAIDAILMDTNTTGGAIISDGVDPVMSSPLQQNDTSDMPAATQPNAGTSTGGTTPAATQPGASNSTRGFEGSRRRPRRRLHHATPRSQEELRDQSALQFAQLELVRVQEARVQSTLTVADAINRLAAAVEGYTEVYSRIHSRSRGRRVLVSESEDDADESL